MIIGQTFKVRISNYHVNEEFLINWTFSINKYNFELTE